MAEEAQQDRTEEATPKRREDARKKGDVPRSRELTMTGVMLAGSGGLLLLAGPISRDLVQAFSSGFSIERAQLMDSASLAPAFAAIAGSAFMSLLPFALVLIAAVFLSATALGGWSFSAKAMSFKGERLSPMKGIKRIFGPNGLNELIKAMAKFSLVAVFSVTWLWWSADDLLSLGRQPIGSAIRNAAGIIGVSFLVVSTALIAIAAVDVPFQIWQYSKKLKMTRQQVKDEFKESEGRPEVKSHMRSLQQQVAARRMMEDVPDADVVITNPTHFAIALKYDDNSMAAPRVVAKGKDLVAKRIREIAAENAVPLFSAPPLARVLFRVSDIGEEIPARLYAAVAQVLAYIFQLNETLRPGQKPMEPPVPDIDEDDFPGPKAAR
jgi:flagellar biosynthetic protein FlhB